METATEDVTGKFKTDIDCVVAGGGPAGMMAGLLLARQGVRVAVLEKHADFLRDFRGGHDPPFDYEGDGSAGDHRSFPGDSASAYVHSVD